MIRVFLLAVVAGLAIVGTAQAAPTFAAAPMISGQAVLGGRLAAEGTVVDEATPDDISFVWERSADGGFAEIPDARDSIYAPTAADVGHRLRVHVVVETAEGVDEAWSEQTEAIAYPPGHERGRLRIGPHAGAPARLHRWTATAGDQLQLSGRLAVGLATADARLLLEPTVPRFAAVEAPVTIGADGGLAATIEPRVNAIAWLEVVPAGETPIRIRLGVVGVRPRIVLVLGARSDGRDARGRALVRDLRVLPGSGIAPGIAGLRLSWEGMLPGDRTGTAVCRSSERIVSGAEGTLRGGCRTRGAWRAARWRLVCDPVSDDPGAAPFLPAASAWAEPHVGSWRPSQVPVLPRSSATLPPWS